MALSKSSLKSRIVAAMEAQGFVVNDERVPVTKLADAIAGAVVDEIQQNASVLPTAFIIGTPTGPGTITGTGTVS